MDIGNQQRVIIVEPELAVPELPAAPVTAGTDRETVEEATAWPLPLDIDPEMDPVS